MLQTLLLIGTQQLPLASHTTSSLRDSEVTGVSCPGGLATLHSSLLRSDSCRLALHPGLLTISSLRLSAAAKLPGCFVCVGTSPPVTDNSSLRLSAAASMLVRVAFVLWCWWWIQKLIFKIFSLTLRPEKRGHIPMTMLLFDAESVN